MENNKSLSEFIKEINETSDEISQVSFFDLFNLPDLSNKNMDYRYNMAKEVAKNFKRDEYGDLYTGAFVLEILGFEELSFNIRRFVNSNLGIIENKEALSALVKNEAISESQREKASKPRNKYYEEVMSVIVNTWGKYPGASQTRLHQALVIHYDGKVSPNSLLKWIKASGAKPPKPKKHTDFKLVLPQ
ncbi:hypothetical protein SMKC032_36950 [Serratia marcescens]|uniref:hypothetical protein n=1 Tax=Serratia marcescens TaxID=615 RepID=UPI001CDB4CC0|nr:hypothetical protein [Serratia marcescens]MCA4112161.1 hypothetical protein [Serratia marcescens]BEN27600.1 hypothetical protein SMKC032_36950 [Serratia marcescens]